MKLRRAELLQESELSMIKSIIELQSTSIDNRIKGIVDYILIKEEKHQREKKRQFVYPRPLSRKSLPVCKLCGTPVAEEDQDAHMLKRCQNE